MRELADPKRERWLAEFERYLPEGQEPLRVLDLGTGTGYFAFLFAAEGHEAVGIDLTESMIEKAKETAALLDLKAEFHVMDAEEPDFEDESFDVLVTRNLTWTLPHLASAYHEWYHLLKPGGVLINFDADYANYAELNDPDNLPENHAHKNIPRDMSEENDEITMEVAAYQQPRPQWDVQLLLRAGFEQVHVDNGIWKRIYAEIDEFYNPTPIFTLVAYKAEK
jgi:ubiquinone/menaquinone biosynthesis C-methylase UbiE